MKQLLNTLYVMTQQSFLRLDHDTVKICVEGEKRGQVPLIHLGGIHCFGNVMVSPALLMRCAEEQRSIVFYDRKGRFKARVTGPTTGNVLLRKRQYDFSEESEGPIGLARSFVAGKIQNCRQLLLRGARDSKIPSDATELRDTAGELGNSLRRLEKARSLDEVRGVEGYASRKYFEVFTNLVKRNRGNFALKGRSRRPPRDPMNALLSFLYTLLHHDCIGACEGVGLDPQVGYLHTIRPGRAAMALDLMEEFRPVLADRLALTLVNLGVIQEHDFDCRVVGSVLLNERGRKTVVAEYQKKKQIESKHPLLKKKTPLGLLPHLQARLLARVLRGDIEYYPPFLSR